MPKFQTPPGMHDILPKDEALWNRVYDTVREVAQAYDFGRIETPVLEFEELFSKGLGQTTDIVEKEMYTLRTKGGDRLALRPEGTAPVVRAYVQHGMKTWPQPVKLWYFSPMFRHERQQAGRFRQFWQFGFEILGDKDVSADVEIIRVLAETLEPLGLHHTALQINSLGCNQCRPYFKKVLGGYLRSRKEQLCANSRKRLGTSPLRVLDCKDERCQRIAMNAPEIIDHLCEECRQHFKGLLGFLDELTVPYVFNTKLVRGLDYYNRTVFEVVPEEEALGEDRALPKAQSAMVAGGRYDLLMKQFGAKDTGAIGGSGGVERIVAALSREAGAIAHPQVPIVFVAQLGEKAKHQAMLLFEDLRKAGILARASFGRDSIKSQLRVADKIGAPFVLIVGQKEALEGTALLRTMGDGTQETVAREDIVKEIRERLKKIKPRVNKS
ncbi:MAG: histidine--tRNA ligase [Candidatus Terrybacteria bacterium RIFCSPLOWO2_01_FULL_48_14]|nr:MAG: histidine--tRNA ligase [Candidatus Terrybacteria bacterium RIFCSPLOWO2_01_FULL_48_14]